MNVPDRLPDKDFNPQFLTCYLQFGKLSNINSGVFAAGFLPGARSVQDLSGAVTCRSISDINSRVLATEFVPRRSLWVTELVKIFEFDKHRVCRWIGHVEPIQDEHYLRMMADDHVKSVDWQNRPQNQPLRYWFVSIRDALYCSESEPA